MTENAFVSMLQEANGNGLQQKVLLSFLPTKDQINMLCKGHNLIKTNTVKNKYNLDSEEEAIKYSEKDVGLAFTAQLSRLLQSEQVQPSTAKIVMTVWGGDHGCDVFQFGASMKVHFSDGTEPFEFDMSACDIICRTDSAELLEKIIVDGLTVGLEKKAESKLNICLDKEKKIKFAYGEKPVTFEDENIKTLNKVFMYVTGDLVLVLSAIALGYESMLGRRCFLCKICHSLFSKLDQHVEMWMMVEFLKVVDGVNDGRAKFGVKKKAWWPCIPLENYMTPILHVLIGPGNDLLYSVLG